MALSPLPRRLATGTALVLAVAGVVLASVSCGKKGTPSGAKTGASDAGPAGPSTPDLSTPRATLGQVARALDAGDLTALDACLTTDAAAGVRRDLLAWKAVLMDPAAGPRALARIPPPSGDAEKAAYRAGFGGDPAGLLLMLARATNRVAAGSAAGGDATVAPTRVDVPEPGAGDRVEGDRILPDGTRRRAVLVRRDGAWRVDRLAL